MNPSSVHRARLYWIGLALGPIAWAINLQTIYAMSPHACAKPPSATVVLSTMMAVLAIAGTLMSWRATCRDGPAELAEMQGGRARNFMAWLGVGSSATFALVILNQLAAAVMISPCLR
jgi:uncharacterized membrane protein YphA (DoxX/SURF4 family)